MKFYIQKVGAYEVRSSKPNSCYQTNSVTGQKAMQLHRPTILHSKIKIIKINIIKIILIK